MTRPLSGILTALATPFCADESIDEQALRAVLDRSLDAAVDGVVVGGSTAEFAAMSSDERRRLTDLVCEHAGDRVPVVAQTGATSTREAIELSRAAQRSGADALMVVPPYYEPIGLAQTVEYVKDVAAAVDLPIMLYNIPAATGVSLDLETVRSLADEIDQVRYIKDSSADWEFGLGLIHHLRDRIETFIGWDSYIFDALTQGAAGVVAGTANVVPQQLVAIARAVRSDDLVGARDAWKAVYPVIDAMVASDFIPAVKEGLRLTGVECGRPRRPLAPLAPESSARLREALDALVGTSAKAGV